MAEPISEHNDLKWLYDGGHLTFGVPGAALMSLCDGFLLWVEKDTVRDG